MQFDSLENNIIDSVKEAQAKIGYMDGQMRLYYPLDSVNKLLDVELSVEEMQNCLNQFALEGKLLAKKVVVTHEGDRFCILISGEGTKFIHETIPDSEFLISFLGEIQKHGCSLTQMEELFLKFNSEIEVIKISEPDFDEAIHFKSGEPDDYFYCLKQEGHHLTYHRFTRKDFEAMF